MIQFLLQKEQRVLALYRPVCGCCVGRHITVHRENHTEHMNTL